MKLLDHKQTYHKQNDPHGIGLYDVCNLIFSSCGPLGRIHVKKVI